MHQRLIVLDVVNVSSMMRLWEKVLGGGKMTYYEFCFAAKIHASSQSRCNKAHAPKPYHARCGQHN